MSVGALRDQLNNPVRFSTPQTTIDAIVHAVRERGAAALKEPATKARLRCCDEAALTQINVRLTKLLGAAANAAS
jgi:hypothetical protein